MDGDDRIYPAHGLSQLLCDVTLQGALEHEYDPDMGTNLDML